MERERHDKLLRAIQGISYQIMELEKRFETLEAVVQQQKVHPLFALLNRDEDSDSASTESAPANFLRQSG